MHRKIISVLTIFLTVILLFCGCKAADAKTAINDLNMSAIDDVVQLPVTNRDIMLKGDAVPFSVGVQMNIHCSDDYNWNVKVAKSLVQLKELYDKDNNPNQYNYIEKYNKAFFKKNAVIVMFITEGSGSFRHKIDSLVKKNGELCIGMTTLGTHGPHTCDTAYWRILLEVKKSDIADAGVISYFNVNQ